MNADSTQPNAVQPNAVQPNAARPPAATQPNQPSANHPNQPSADHPNQPALPDTIAGSLLDLIGNTPMVRLVAVAAGIKCPVVAKLETVNPGGSVKDRPALAMIEAAEKAGLLKPGGTIIEPTSGNTGVGLAIVAAQRGYKCVFVMTDKVAPEKVDLLAAYGAEVVLCPVAVAPEDPQSYYSTAKRLLDETPDAFSPSQYHNPINPQAHYDSTGPEIWQQTQGRITHFVAGAGTGGTISGVGRYLKEQNPQIQIIVADPDASVYSGGSGRPYLVEGIGEDFWPSTYDTSVVDRVLPVTDAESFDMARRVTQTEGLLIGGSGGTAVFGALQVASELTENDLVVTLIPDSGRGYLSRVFNDDWLTSMGFDTSLATDSARATSRATAIDPAAIDPAANETARASATGASTTGASTGATANETNTAPPFVYVQPTDTVAHALETMKANGLAAISVAKGDMPVAAAEIVGSISLAGIHGKSAGRAEQQSEMQAQSETPVELLLEPPLPQVGVGEPPERAQQLLEQAPAVVLFSQGRPIATLSAATLSADTAST